jgi:hemerythrin-like domain-containing protein
MAQPTRRQEPEADARADGEPRGVVDTRVIHDVHRRGTSLLATAATDETVPADALGALRTFVVAQLHHHHESEDGDLWPRLIAADPQVADGLAALSVDHDRLAAALDALAAVPIGGDDRSALVPAAIAVRDLVQAHLEREEALLLPALRAHVGDDEWDAFAARTIESAPLEGTELLIGLLDLVATPQEVEAVLQPMPPEARTALPAIRAQAKQTLTALHAIP